ncbi:MAG: diaminopimelate decarboxylase [Clostridiales bacterium]|nr:diaminopimelate decarboxylase [Clostridiales bacterium]
MQKTARALQEAFSWNPRFKEYFAVKALPNPHIGRLLVGAGCGLDCSSHCELMIAELLGVKGDNLMFSANAMPPQEFAFARRLQGIINLDDITDIDTLQQNGGIPDTICLRYNPGGDFGDGNAIMGSPRDSKFGMTRPQLSESLHRLKALGVKRFGLHAFLASNMLGEVYYPLLARLLFETGKELQAETGLELSFVNLSGGVGIPYRPTDAAPDIGLIGRRVETVYREAFGSDNSVAIKTELGRYVTGPHGWLVARARHEKRTHKHYIGLDACASNLLRPAMYGAYHHISVAGKRDAEHTHTYDITGALCENNDKFAIDRALPPIELGDLVIIHDAGAHAHTMGYQYNGRLRSAEVLYRPDGSFQLIRRAETPEDYFATLHGEGLPAL